MFELTFRDYLKCGHSLKGEIFGPAQVMHVITYEVDVTYYTDTLDAYGLIVDFGAAQADLEAILARLNFKNLDELPEFKEINTTTEFLCQYIHEQMCEKLAGKFSGTLKVTLRESPVAWTSYTNPVPE